GVGFEPTEALRLQRFSRPPHSSALPPLRCSNDAGFVPLRHRGGIVLCPLLCPLFTARGCRAAPGCLRSGSYAGQMEWTGAGAAFARGISDAWPYVGPLVGTVVGFALASWLEARRAARTYRWQRRDAKLARL